MKEYIKSKKLSYLLRHNPQELNMDRDGYVKISEILVKLEISLEDLKNIVLEDDKKRFSFNYNGDKLRASQGHSINVDIKFIKKIPPVVLYHGTASRFWDSIKKHGLKKMNRQYVHLSKDIETAYKVGVRHGEPIILKIDCLSMVKNGYEFFISDNGVWLTDNVPPQYITKK